MTSGLRKLDLGAGKGLAVANGIGGSNQPSFYQTQNLNQVQSQNPAYLSNTIQQPGILQDDINQRQGTMSFGGSITSFGGNSMPAYNRPPQSNILNQSIDSSSSASSSQSSNFHSPQNHGPGVMASSAFMKGGLMQSNFNQTRQSANVFQYGAQNPGLGQTTSQNPPFSNQFQSIPSQFSTISSSQSDYQDTPYRAPSQAQTTPFQFINPGPKSMMNTQQNGLLVHQDSFNKGFKFNQTIYENPVVIRVKSQDREEYDQQFMIKLALHAQSTTSQQQLLTLEVTDEVNPYFLYSLECLETDFHLIKQGQQLHFDYQTFPHYIADQFEKCMACIKQDQPMQTIRRYVCQLQVGVSNEAVLAFIEQTQYQSLIVLNLKLKQGNDESIKKHLATKLREQKDINESLRNNLFNLEDQFSKLKTESDQLRESSQRTQEQLISELNSLKDENKRIVSQMKLEEEKKLHELRERTLLENTENQARIEAEKRNYMSLSEKTIRDLNDQRDQMRIDYEQQLLQLQSRLEQQMQDQKSLYHEQIQKQIKETQVIVNQVNASWEQKFVNYEETILRMNENHQKAMFSMQEKIEKRELLIDERKEIDFTNKELRTKIDSLLHEIEQINIAHQSTKDTMSNQLKFKEAEIEMLKNELNYLRDTNKGLDNYKFSQEKQLTELQLKRQSHDREVQDKQEIIDRVQALLESTKQQKDQIEQALLDEKAKTTKMQDKLLLSKTEIENASKYIEKLKQEKKDLQKKIKTKNSVVLQQETQIQQKQEQIDDQMKLINEIRRENDRQCDSIQGQVAQAKAESQHQINNILASHACAINKIEEQMLRVQQESSKKDIEIKELQSLNQMLKTKLEESQKSLESNAQMISWLNKQLNEKGIGTSMMPSSFKNTTTSSVGLNKPPSGVSVSGISTGGFKPSFSSVDQLSSGGQTVKPTKVSGAFERSPLRNTTNSLAAQSPIGSMNTSTNSFSSNPIGVTGTTSKAAPSTLPKAFNYPASTLPKEPASQASNENQSANLPVQVINPPQFVSKYTQQLYLQQQQQELQSKAPVASSAFTKQYSSSSLASANQYQPSNASSDCNYGSQPNSQIGTMSFNPYSAGKFTQANEELQSKLGSMKFSEANNFEDDSHQELESNNNTQMSGGDAFQAFLSKNDGDEEEDDE